MGLENREGGNWITIYDGKFTQRVDENVTGATQRVNKLGKSVYEKYYDNFTGKLINIRTQDSPYGKQWVFDFKDREDIYHLTLSYANGFASTFLKILPNIDVSKEIKVSTSTKEVDGKKKNSLFVNQDGVALKHAYSKENPNGLPQWEQVVVKGVQVWDNTKELEFLENMVKTTILPKLEGLPVDTAEAKADAEFDSYGKEPEAIDPDSIPF
jgi:hypothetical protein